MSVIKKAILWGIAFLLFIDVHGVRTNDCVNTRDCVSTSVLIPQHHGNQAGNDKAAQGGSKQELSPYPLAAANEFRVVMIEIALCVDIAYQPDLFTWLTVRCKKTSSINVLVKQWVAVTQNQQ
ncbi:hypothetical protein BSK71_16190 [Pectobacterium actinidiae]|uniref:Uncharacterized protein n=1 Tax=Pectobacterium actinidiae TaxID=1507808 RepID=A0A1V2R1Q6_9GAMM|nr:hypothetical protein BSK69_14555 [Pectobacterium actinidiae]ONK03440.1 hypothetical protein BSK71_16190 [Pectobacterium actinidiae]